MRKQMAVLAAVLFSSVVGCGAESDTDPNDALSLETYSQPIAGDCSDYVSDVNYLDYSNVTKGTTITKKWKIKNCGTTNWTTSYQVVKESGSAGFCTSFTLTSGMSAGSTAEIWATCNVPNTAGQYSANFKVADYNGTKFGDAFWVIVNAQ
ncbi:hypothetical protein HPP05_20150 [Corallococcus exiguus]|uniref:NBR1-Ig-like domain-containing protein n=1 Tax=Corallococcus TaxID=83461 RepID=UPI000EC30BAA|nr:MULTISPECIES: NBR1-Ig-like domain-containing protein [Corallococcus]NPC72069.1 hypothetical protein [Corallococcus exiguus]RKH93042.1 hypothetical protein D7Y04_41820 [Corallococcus sp. AB038B]